MNPQVIRPRHRIPWRRVIVALVIAWAGWTASRVLEGLERADRRTEVQRTLDDIEHDTVRIERSLRGLMCTSTVYYAPCPTGVWCYGEAGLSGWCRP